MKIRAIIKRPDEEIGHVTNVSNTLENLQRTVGGYIETVTFRSTAAKEKNFVVICDEEGRLKGEEHCCTVDARRTYAIGYPVEFVGTIVALGINGDEFTDCPISRKLWAELIKPREEQDVREVYK